MAELVIISQLDVAANQVWEHAVTMAGVNEELAPLVAMHVPAAARGKTIADAPLGEVAFHSWVLLFGVVPFDRHTLRLDAIEPGRGFRERSHSLLQRAWRHDRAIEPNGAGCTLTDRVGFEPRAAFATPLVRAIVGRIFRHRHARLHRRFGGRLLQFTAA